MRFSTTRLLCKGYFKGNVHVDVTTKFAELQNHIDKFNTVMYKSRCRV